MALDASKAFVAVTGSANSFPAGTPIEYGANAPIPVGYTNHGLATDAGVVYGPNRSITTIRGWQNAQIIRSLVTEADFTVTVTLAQILDDENKQLAYGRGKNAVTGGYHIDPSQTGGVRSWIFDAIDPSRKKKVRVYIPQAEVTEVGEISWLSSELSTLAITLTTYPVVIEGESANAIEWTDDWVQDDGGDGGDGGGEYPNAMTSGTYSFNSSAGDFIASWNTELTAPGGGMGADEYTVTWDVRTLGGDPVSGTLSVTRAEIGGAGTWQDVTAEIVDGYGTSTLRDSWASEFTMFSFEN